MQQKFTLSLQNPFLLTVKIAFNNAKKYLKVNISLIHYTLYIFVIYLSLHKFSKLFSNVK